MQEFEAKESSNVGWARYDPATETLEIDFKGARNGTRQSTYTYAGFPQSEWEAFQRAESKGRHFAYQIRPRFKGIKKLT